MYMANTKIITSTLNLGKINYSALVMGFFEGKLEIRGKAKEVNEKFDNVIEACIKNGDFKGEKGETKNLFINKGDLKYIVLVGLGEQSKYKLETFNSLIANISKKLRSSNIEKFGVLLETFSDGKIAEEQIAENAAISSVLGLYQFTEYKTKELDKIKNVNEITLVSEKDINNVTNKSNVVAEAITKTRDLINAPPNVANPTYVANYAKELAKNSSLKCTVLNESDLKKLKMNCCLAVAKGSKQEPKFVVLEYNGAGKEKPVALVGKGITFDSGGLNLKPYPHMSDMKCDMSGASSVIHVIEACASLKLPVNVVAITPLCENMPSSDSYRPDDVLTAYNGMTVEVKNTDAEGRMVLADTLAYAEDKFKPSAIVDVATLTGASIVVLGTIAFPIMGNDQKLMDNIKEASEKSLEKVWELPLWEEYDELLKSDIADIKHLNEEGGAGAIIGGIFLKNFVKDTPWVHLDIGSTAWSKTESGTTTKGATGATVRLLIEFLKNSKQ